MVRALYPLLVWGLVACDGGDDKSTDAPAPTPLDLPLADDGITRAGAASVDMNPTITETFDDVDGDGTFEGCLDDPGCEESFDDADGDGTFDAVWIGGFGYLRPANDIHADGGVTARAVVLTHGEDYLIFAVADLVGLTHVRIDEVGRILAEEDGVDPDRVIISSTHNHQGPDTMGLWGDPLAGVSGYDPAYQDQVVTALVDAIRIAAAEATEVDLTVGAVNMRDLDPYFNGAAFGGRNPTDKMHGMVHDIRDPVIVSDQVFALQGTDDVGDTVFTFTTWSGHPEVFGSRNNEISSDWVGVTRQVLEDTYGGVAVHMPESLGGMQSSLGGELPLVLDDGTHAFQTCSAEAVADPDDEGCFERTEGDTRLDDAGDPVPVWAEQNTWEYVRSHGWHIAEAAITALDQGESMTPDPIRVEVESGWVPIRNLAYNLLGPQGIFDIGLEDATNDPALCAQAPEVQLGCIPFRTFRAQLGPVGLVTAPGELVPELAWGFPEDDPQWVAEAADPTARGPGSRYFPQHPRTCDTVDPDACMLTTDPIDGCDCLEVHAWPYRLADEPTVPVLDRLDTKYRMSLSNAATYISYILPEPDVNRSVSLLSGGDGDHYEDTVTPAWDFATVWLQAQDRIDERW